MVVNPVIFQFEDEYFADNHNNVYTNTAIPTYHYITPLKQVMVDLDKHKILTKCGRNQKKIIIFSHSG